MASVREIIHRLMPQGTNPSNGPPSWEVFPVWPPDMFAVMATLVTQAGLYCRPCFAGGPSVGAYAPECVVFARRVGPRWAREELTEADENRLQALWRIVYETNEGETCDEHELCPRWWDPALKLLLAADEASVGVGFGTLEGDLPVVAERVLNEHALFLENPALYDQRQTRLPYLPNSLCEMVPASEACVQPKSRTSQLGLTLRSLTHHLALLPMRGEVSTSWMIGFSERQLDMSPLNLLLIPFPFRLGEDCFRDGGRVQEHVIRRVAHDQWEAEDGGHGNDQGHWHGAESVIEARARYFQLHQTWLTRDGDDVTANRFIHFLEGMMGEARRQRREVNAIILPELALARLMQFRGRVPGRRR